MSIRKKKTDERLFNIEEAKKSSLKIKEKCYSE
jgi:hypothetical protein